MSESFEGTCKDCGRSFSVPAKTMARFPGWTPTRCMVCTKNQGTSKRQPPVEASGPAMKSGIYTDGSCLGNPGPGGWALVHVEDGAVVGEASGSDPHTTNNRMELRAMIEAFRRLPPTATTTIWSDSDLVVNTATKWAAAWEKQGWKRRTGPVENLDLVQELYAEVKKHPSVQVKWLRGHAGHKWNERANDLAIAASKAAAGR